MLLVGSVQSGSPAEAAGLQAGDELVAVAGAPVEGRTTAEVVSALRGDPGTTVAVTVRRAGGDEAVTLTRATLAADDVSLEARKGGVSVLRVAAFTRGVGAQVRAALAAADPATYRTGIVLDLRANPGRPAGRGGRRRRGVPRRRSGRLLRAPGPARPHA